MPINIPVLAVVGHKNSGKTTVIEGLISELSKKRFHVATAKHVSQRGFSMDTKGSDTWRHSAAGANPVIIVSDVEISVLIRDGIEKFSLEKMFMFTQETGANILILEGFSSMILKDRQVGKVICLRNLEEYKEYKEIIREETLAFCSFQPLGEPILKISEDLPVLAERALRFIEKREKIIEILDRLPSLDCKKCGRATCGELAEDIYEGKASLNDCVPLKLRTKLKTKITIEGAEIPIQPFVSEIVRKSVLGMVSTLKGIAIKGDEKVRIEISRK